MAHPKDYLSYPQTVVVVYTCVYVRMYTCMYMYMYMYV